MGIFKKMSLYLVWKKIGFWNKGNITEKKSLRKIRSAKGCWNGLDHWLKWVSVWQNFSSSYLHTQIVKDGTSI